MRVRKLDREVFVPRCAYGEEGAIAYEHQISVLVDAWSQLSMGNEMEVVEGAGSRQGEDSNNSDVWVKAEKWRDPYWLYHHDWHYSGKASHNWSLPVEKADYGEKGPDHDALGEVGVR